MRPDADLTGWLVARADAAAAVLAALNGMRPALAGLARNEVEHTLAVLAHRLADLGVTVLGPDAARRAVAAALAGRVADLAALREQAPTTCLRCGQTSRTPP